MPDEIWYYAEGDKEQGPITTAQIKALIQTGKIKPGDLVWKEGMDDWTAAGKAPGLFSAPETVSDSPPSAAGAARTKIPGETPPRIEAPSRPAGAAPTPPPAAPPPGTTASSAAPSAPAAAAAPTRTSNTPSLAIQPKQLGRWVGWALLAVGLFLVLTAKGCESMAHRYVQRLRAISESAEATFQDEWDQEKNDILDEQQALRDKKDSSPRDVARLAELDAKLTKLNEEMGKLQAQNRRGAWQERAASARRADASQRMWSYWRELWFVFGSLVFSAGLVAIGLCGEGVERWLSLVLLAIVVASLYVVGVAWSGGPLGG